MSMHRVEFNYMIPEWGSLETEIDDVLDYVEKEEIAINEIKDIYPDVENIEIAKIVQL